MTKKTKTPPILNLPDTPPPLGEHVRVTLDYGVTDARGRGMGMEVVIRHVPPFPATPLSFARPARFASCLWATRDGARHGAIASAHTATFATWAEARDAAEKYVVTARDRALAAARDRASKT